MQKKSTVRGTRQSKALGTREKRRLIQLGLCVGLFLVVFLGRGAAPTGILDCGETLLQMIRSDTDFKGAFSAVGEAVSRGDSVLGTLGKLAVEVFGAGEREEVPQADTGVSAPLSQAALASLTRRPTSETILGQLGLTVPEEPAAEQEPESEPEPSPAVQVPEYTGPALPEGATMDYYDLGLAETVTPVMGELTSAYGYRDHPVNGEYLFHAGIDLAADTGTPILAFADGTVEYIGESDAYGLYIQIDHGNGVKTFYCHCSELYARKGESVTMGQSIAAVGETGNATGPHLHLEIKLDDVHLNPIYYVETAE